jgi:hypothetical protein
VVGVDDYGHSYVAWQSFPADGSRTIDPAKSRIMLADRLPRRPWRTRALTDLGASRPEIGVAPSGRVGLGWITGDPNDGSSQRVASLWATTAAPGVEFPAAQLLSTNAVLSPPTSRAVATSRDETFVVWEDASDGNHVAVARAGPDGAFSKPQRLSAGWGRFPVIAMNAAGATVVAWQVGAGPTSVEYSYRAPGGEFGPVRTLSSGGSYGPVQPWVAVNGDGDALVTWYEGSPPTAYAATRRAHGAGVAPRLLGPGVPRPTAVGLHGFGVVLTVKTGARVDSLRDAASLISSTDGGQTFGEPEQLPGDALLRVGTVIDLAGNAMTVWMGPGPQSLFESSRPFGGSWGPDTPIFDRTSNPVLKASATGHVVAAWLRYDGSGNTPVIAADGTVLTAAPDTTAPQLETGPLRRKGTVLRIAVKCNEPCSVRWRASARNGRRTLKASGEPVKASLGESRVVTARLPRIPRRTKVRLQLVVTDLSGNATRVAMSR